MSYYPEQGDIIIIDLDPQSGHEQKGRRPAVVVSRKAFFTYTKMAILCPITNTDKNFPLHVKLDDKTNITGVIMCEQVKSLDISSRNATFIEKLPSDILEEVIDILSSFIE